MDAISVVNVCECWPLKEKIQARQIRLRKEEGVFLCGKKPMGSKTGSKCLMRTVWERNVKETYGLKANNGNDFSSSKI